ncbi:Nif3-like dinuclear metal center hexameric protein [Paenibacillus melissococcoides]|uniref:GTP cyclohydrolase 1 type 2 homolog n=1 Tax=Paenibacillus melissococcoides TaxID=2912268 RepID=A0ABN8U289_9BACL|nr:MULTISPECIES: Nif3-like dinuclear metal center hexameric protein [Paenibacillus]MEB9893996.1 Nif3-like dinuclear metal center hexameric protein [Bacillus cereus]CAH8245199.1 Nif3-like dinuclear metal center hexameric protein [Paenibacillus melissococcoides]CAH8710265.1 Nif3-like dinuclear metal center hexameric protein [Paenibacillus melissococcoides]CAH8711034.1 Nif3-like dinuclear metal center hexameric protein [Paenibacillus melissococcoides]GIO81437.1 GTP cyclohydrolase 1 type 2 [Paenib
MYAHAQTVIQWMEQLAPKSMAVPDDRIGLQLGTLNKKVSRVLVALDVTEEVVDEAIRLEAELIIAHHAIIYRPLPHLQTDTPAGKLMEKLIKHDIAVYISHTNYDVAPGGMNDLMADRLQLAEVEVLEKLHEEPLQKLVVFVPTTHADSVRMAILDAGAGHIGAYSHCSFSQPGTGTFRPQEGTNPFIGESGKLESVEEVRIETIVPKSRRSRVLQAMFKAHPYEEVAYDLYPVDLEGTVYGLGRVGKLPAPMTLQAFAEQVKKAFDVPHVRVVGSPEREVKKIAVLGGSGSRYVRHALFHGADVLVTGDIDYHTAHDALAAGLAIVDPGHNAEKMMKEDVASRLQQAADKQGVKTVFHASSVITEPFQFM